MKLLKTNSREQVLEITQYTIQDINKKFREGTNILKKKELNVNLRNQYPNRKFTLECQEQTR